MELWVRSQDKSTLAKVIQIHIDSKIIYANDNESSIWTNLGVYTTKERCLEILEKIQKLICDSKNTTIVYQMPEK